MSQIKKKYIENNAIDNTKLDQSSNYDFDANNGSVKVKTPTEGKDATNKEYVDGLIDTVNTTLSNLSIREVENLVYTDTINKVIELSHIPTTFEDVLFFPNEGSAQEYGVDYTISIKDDVAYICLATNSTPPSGGSWDTENLPSIGMIEVINGSGGDTITVEYLYNGNVLASPTGTSGTQGPIGPQGPQGLVGTTGFDGPQGVQGSNGNQGPQGLTGSVGTISEPTADMTTSGITDVVTVGESVSFGTLLYLKSDGLWYSASNATIATMPALRMATSSATIGTSCSTLVLGRVWNSSWTFTVGGLIYVSTSGSLTQTAPSSSTNIVQIVGVAYHANKIVFQPSFSFVEIK